MYVFPERFHVKDIPRFVKENSEARPKGPVPAGFSKEQELSKELSSFLGKTKASRAEITKGMYESS